MLPRISLYSTIVASVAVLNVVAQDATVYQVEDVVCAGVKRAIYSTQLEFDEDPCDFSCFYDATTGQTQAQCRYNYCEVRVSLFFSVISFCGSTILIICVLL